ncbi:hypothetical protein V2O64_00630 [Verrucomicrobiaceae bacterium 227]
MKAPLPIQSSSSVAALMFASLVLSATPSGGAISILWDFYDGAGNDNGWTVIAGAANYRTASIRIMAGRMSLISP